MQADVNLSDLLCQFPTTQAVHERNCRNRLEEPRWAPALAILAVLALLAVLPHHVQLAATVGVLPGCVTVLYTHDVVNPTNANKVWLLVERRVIMLFAVAYIVNTTAELADMIGIITLHPPETRQISLLSSSLAIWVTNVLTFSLVYWQIDAGGPSARATRTSAKPDWLFPQATVARSRLAGLASDGSSTICFLDTTPRRRSAPPCGAADDTRQDADDA